MSESSLTFLGVGACLLLLTLTMWLWRQRRSAHLHDDTFGFRVIEIASPTDEKQALWNELTVREREVAHLAVQGYRNRDIARELTISKNTVDSHLKGVYGKLQVHNRVELTRFLHALGLD